MRLRRDNPTFLRGLGDSEALRWVSLDSRFTIHEHEHEHEHELTISLRFTMNNENGGCGDAGVARGGGHGAREGSVVAAVRSGFAAPLDGGHGTPS